MSFGQLLELEVMRMMWRTNLIWRVDDVLSTKTVLKQSVIASGGNWEWGLSYGFFSMDIVDDLTTNQSTHPPTSKLALPFFWGELQLIFLWSFIVLWATSKPVCLQPSLGLECTHTINYLSWVDSEIYVCECAHVCVCSHKHCSDW